MGNNLGIVFKELLLVFLSRQGFWSDDKNISNKNLFLLTCQYIVLSILIFLMMILLKENITNLLSNLFFSDIVSYFNILFYSLYIIIFVGIIYENFYFIKCNSISTFNIFFRFTLKKIWLLNYLKNLIVILPALIFLSFYNIMCPIVLVTITHILSYYFINKYYHIKINGFSFFLSNNNKLNKLYVSIKYLTAVMRYKDTLKYLLTPIFSILILVLIEKYDKDIMLFQNYYSAFFSGLIFSSIFFSSKLPSSVFFSLNLDIPYLKILDINIKKLIWKYVNYISLFQIFLTVIIFKIISDYFFSLDGKIIYILLFSLIVGFLFMSLIQLKQSFYYKSISLSSPHELEAYKLPIKEKLFNYFYNIFIILFFMILNRIDSPYKNILFCIFIFLLLCIFLYLVKYINRELEEY